MRWACVAFALVACGNRGESTGIMNASRSVTPTTWVYRLCNDTQLEIEHLFFATEGGTDAILGTSLAPGSCSSYGISVGLHRAFDLRFLVGANDQHALRGKAPGLLPYGAWSFHIKLVDPAGHGITVDPVEDHPMAWTRICNHAGEALDQLLFYGYNESPDLAAGECTAYHPAYEPSGYGEGEFFWADPEGKYVGQKKHTIVRGPQSALTPGRWTFVLVVKDSVTAELRRNAKPDQP